MDYDQISQILFLVLFAVLGAAWACLLMQVLRKSAGAGLWAQRLLYAALAWNVAALIYRGIYAGHAPWANQYESATMVAFGVVLLYTIFQRRHQVPLLGPARGARGHGGHRRGQPPARRIQEDEPLMPALQSYWLKIHVSLMLLSYGSFATTFGLSLMFLIKDGAWTKKTNFIALPIAGVLGGLFFAYVHAAAHSPFWLSTLEKLQIAAINGNPMEAYLLFAAAGLVIGVVAALAAQQTPLSFMGLLPEKDLLDELNYQSVAVGFPMLTLGVILGAMWGHIAWGRYWGWDPKETWAFISWLIFAFFLHMRIFAGWNGRRIAWIGLLGAGSIVYTYWGVNFLLSGLHAYAKGT